MIQFTQYVGDAPGTTTMQMNGLSGLGICPPGYYTPAIQNYSSGPAPAASSQGSMVTVSPYATESALKGVGCCPPVNSINGLGLARIRWDLVALAFGVGFAGILGFALYRRKHGSLRGLRESKTVRVYFADIAKTRDVQVTPEVWRKLRELKKTGDTYYATTRSDYLALRPYVRDDD